MTRPLWIVKVGETVEPLRARRGDFEDWFRAGLGLDAHQAPMVRPHLGEPLPDLADVAAAIVTGSPAMVTDEAPWSRSTEAWMRAFAETERPLLGVCYGHQLLARAFGGRVGWCPAGREIGSVEIELLPAARDDALFGGLPATIIGQTSHSQSVLELPPESVHLARNAHDPHQAFRIGPAAWGVQFHPEFDADIVRGYLEARRHAIEEEGLEVDARMRAARDRECGGRLLARFRSIVGQPADRQG